VGLRLGVGLERRRGHGVADHRPVQVARNPLGSALVGKELWVPCIDANEIDVVDPVTMRVVSRTHVGDGPIVVLPAVGHVWISNTLGNELLRL
jgi:hypothetical protein